MNATTPPDWNIMQYRSGHNDLGNCESHEQFRELLMLCLWPGYLANPRAAFSENPVSIIAE